MLFSIDNLPYTECLLWHIMSEFFLIEPLDFIRLYVHHIMQILMVIKWLFTYLFPLKRKWMVDHSCR